MSEASTAGHRRTDTFRQPGHTLGAHGASWHTGGVYIKHGGNVWKGKGKDTQQRNTHERQQTVEGTEQIQTAESGERNGRQHNKRAERDGQTTWTTLETEIERILTSAIHTNRSGRAIALPCRWVPNRPALAKINQLQHLAKPFLPEELSCINCWGSSDLPLPSLCPLRSCGRRRCRRSPRSHKKRTVPTPIHPQSRSL